MPPAFSEPRRIGRQINIPPAPFHIFPEMRSDKLSAVGVADNLLLGNKLTRPFVEILQNAVFVWA
jgi:hypothetical protein